MTRKAKILIYCMIFVGYRGFCQKSIHSNSYTSISTTQNVRNTLPVNKLQGSVYTLQNPLPSLLPINYLIIDYSPIIDPLFYTKTLGFFCKRELLFEKSTRIPLKLRLGSVQYCDWLEGKSNSVKTSR